MAYTHFLVPAEGGEAEKRLDVFLRSHAILKIEQRFVDRAEGVFWAYAIHYDALPASPAAAMPKRELGKDRVDYEKVLSEADFAVYVKLRDWRSSRVCWRFPRHIGRHRSLDILVRAFMIVPVGQECPTYAQMICWSDRNVQPTNDELDVAGTGGISGV